MNWKLILVAGALALSGCKKAPDSSKALGRAMNAELDGAPDWITGSCQSSKEFKGNRKKTICAAGSMTGSSNISMARDAAANRARVEVARQLETMVAGMIKDYQQTAATGAPITEGITDEQYVVNVSRSITTATVNGSEIKSMWVSKTGTVWALVGVDVDKFLGVVDGMTELDAQTKERLRQAAEREWDELDTITGG